MKLLNLEVSWIQLLIKLRLHNPGIKSGLSDRSFRQSYEACAIRIGLQFAEHWRDLALFNLAIDSKLRGSDLVSLRVEIALRDVATVVNAAFALITA